MDRMSALLDGPRARGAFVLRCLLQPPWAMHVRDEAPLTVVAVVRGEAWITQGDVVVHAPPGSVALVVGPEPYDITSAPGADARRRSSIPASTARRSTASRSRCRCASVCAAGVTRVDAPTAILAGTYEHHSVLGADLLATLPTPVIVRRPIPIRCVDLLAAELDQRRCPASRPCSTVCSTR